MHMLPVSPSLTLSSSSSPPHSTMTSWRAKALRGLAAFPFLLVSLWCLQTMDLEKVVAQQGPFGEAGTIRWEGGGELPIIEHFYNVDLLDGIWRGTMATFAPSTLGFDSIGSWQMFSFLIDVGPLQAIWLLESRRGASAYTPALL